MPPTPATLGTIARLMIERIRCRRCKATFDASREDDATLVPPGWRRVAVLTARPGIWVADSLDVFEPVEGYWLCPAHTGWQA